MLRRLAALACAVAALAPGVFSSPLRAQDAPRVNPDAKAVAAFQREVAEFAELRLKLERTLPALATDATPDQIDLRQRALGVLVQKARRGAKPGDIFTSDVRPVLRRLLNGVFNAPDGNPLRRTIMDENPGQVVKLQVNGRYPDTVPLSSVPPQVLRVLPPLPDGLEYRFIGTSLILLDAPSHIIVDFLSAAIPR